MIDETKELIRKRQQVIVAVLSVANEIGASRELIQDLERNLRDLETHVEVLNLASAKQLLSNSLINIGYC